MNIAVVHGYYRFIYLLNSALRNQPSVEQDIPDRMIEFGLDPNDNNTDLDNPVGIANVAAQKVVDAFLNDEMNALGDHPNTMSPGEPYADYTEYSTVNGPKYLTFPNRW
eukprot:gb/GECH01005874.1/.p1 GENE.gb/GECH01005874.1/~~gb/GECH01005874.1/.p1  ORF type:complete len:109 (+),score=13.37 gb/GECH01005874.1/:1-327(+)